MGVDCKVYLPSRVRVRDVASVIGALLGAEVRRDALGDNGSIVAHVQGVKVKACGGSLVECCEITYQDRWFLFHFEFGRRGEPGIMPRCTAKNIAMCKRLADFFGGRVDFSDCDSSECDYFVDEQDGINAEDGAEWNALQQRICDVQPLTEREIEACEKFAAYPTRETA